MRIIPQPIALEMADMLSKLPDSMANLSVENDSLRSVLDEIRELNERLNENTREQVALEQYRNFAMENINKDGECEIDSSAVVSQSDDGAYVEAWVWVDEGSL